MLHNKKEFKGYKSKKAFAILNRIA